MYRIATIVALAGIASTASAQSFNLGGGSIPDNDPTGLVLTSGPVNGMLDLLDHVGVSMTFNPAHSFLGDLIARLDYDAGSNGTIDGSMFLFNRVGRAGSGFGDSSNMSGTYFFTDGGANLWDAAGAVGADAVVPDINTQAYAASGPGSGAAVTFASVFGGLSSSGTWTLTITDSATADTGGISVSSVSVSTVVPTPGTAALMGLGSLALIRRRR